MIVLSVCAVLLLEEINVKDDWGESLRITLSTLLAGGFANISNAKNPNPKSQVFS